MRTFVLSGPIKLKNYEKFKSPIPRRFFMA